MSSPSSIFLIAVIPHISPMSSDRTIIPIMGKFAKSTQFWFKSTLFEIEPGEDKETNPRCYGKHLANWLRQKLVEKGYAVEGVGPEDGAGTSTARRSLSCFGSGV